ncbi:TetR/AcrR family transcriptional regulator [Rhizorhapis suberifaciens]|uniref:AcrR family transcriptional regulator n=1 Tax=Rhizorhapis suberifaciens TaxID=13656 RepID=A0A840HWD7_9SPHN|nr:TetR/AcrR family transcriptional regulator [Rhizorhapis suberifaciens]MBB4641890.1 AcrR family transcriptional regulator [Rhizorhapis suberifaciens]
MAEGTCADIERTNRYQAKYERILEAASALINDRGAKAMTFADVAQTVGLNTTSVTYYFKRKELLAAACYNRSIERLESFIERGESGKTPQERVMAFLDANFEDMQRVRKGETASYAGLSELRALDEQIQQGTMKRYRAMFRRLRSLFGESDDERERAIFSARANVLLENIYWLPVWLERYDLRDFDRVKARTFDIFENGIAAPGQGWNPHVISLDAVVPEAGPKNSLENFLRAATVLINDRGYRGTSVDRIASELHVTKGSFYHHLDAKDDLVLACFRRSFDIIARSQHAADESSGSYWQHLSSSIATLLEVQFFHASPLLHGTARQSLPAALRTAVFDESTRLARRYAGMMMDGIAEGTVRPVDALIAAQMIMAMLNSAYHVRAWARRLSPHDAKQIYAGAIAFGIFGNGREDGIASPQRLASST